MISRRNCLGLGVLGTLASIGVSSEFSLDSLTIRNEEITMQVEKLPKEFADYRIGFLSDFHFGAFAPPEFIADSLKRIAAAKVDLLLFGGDFIGLKDSLRHYSYGFLSNVFPGEPDPAAMARFLFDQIARMLSSCSAPDGVFTVFGNHDRHLPMAERIKLFNGIGVVPLVNERVEIRRSNAVLELVGTDDLWYGTPYLPSMSLRPQQQSLRILLTHNPDVLSMVYEHSPYRFDIGLAGHTHGGQIKFPLLGALEYNVTDQRFREGLQILPESQVYTTRGLGMVKFPLRLNCPPEVSIIRLVGA